jgi:hypothetical protein
MREELEGFNQSSICTAFEGEDHFDFDFDFKSDAVVDLTDRKELFKKSYLSWPEEDNVNWYRY